MKLNEQYYRESLHSALIYPEEGKILSSRGMLFEAFLPHASLGSICEIEPGISAEVVGFTDQNVFLMPYEETRGVDRDSKVTLKMKTSTITVGTPLLGRIVDARGEPLDSKGKILFSNRNSEKRYLYNSPTHVLKRPMITDQLVLGIRSIDGMLSCGQGQRLGIFAGSGVGKSVLLGMMGRNTSADVNVIALIGERGREVREFIERDLGEEGLKRSIIVVATSDQSPLLRMRGAYLASSIAEFFRDQGKHVLLMMDSLTRFCMAQREIGLSAGEPPTTKGYTPSVFSTLPKLLERAGTSPLGGSITGFYSVLVEGDDLDDPIADSARSILDGHIVLSRKLAYKNQYPSVDILQSASRVMKEVISKDHAEWAGSIREWYARYQEAEDLISIGAYVKGTNPKIDESIIAISKINQFLRQKIDEKITQEETLAMMNGIVRSVHGQTSAQSVQGS